MWILLQFNYTLKALTGQPFRAARSCFYFGLSATAPLCNELGKKCLQKIQMFLTVLNFYKHFLSRGMRGILLIKKCFVLNDI